MSINPNAIVPPHRPTIPYERRRKSNLATWLWVGAFFLFIGACGFGVFWSQNGGIIGCVLTQCDKNPGGSPALWSEIVSTADEAAHKAVPSAVLKDVSAKPIARWSKGWSTANTLKITFSYEDANGETLYVDMYDTDPGATASVWGPAINHDLRSNRDISTTRITEHYRTIKINEVHRREALSRIRVLPRQAEVLTWKEGLAEARNDNTEIAPWIFLDFGFGPEGVDTPPTWRVTYKPVPADGPPGMLDFSYILSQSSAFVVDATTGKITGRDTSDSLFAP
jgi:hypothetical protein